ncbi:transposase [Rhodococcus ruber BKS 20-38]|uniref:Transposase n=1 Tax=Rhodococcus ruber BKS 20-38 TaxID=1278076 RepID=M3A470_9NOCA|nr:transposase [Rhodococcus ruber BKS 20-38]
MQLGTVEIGDRHRLPGRSIGACLGLVPIDPSGEGGEQVAGVLTKIGHGHVRWLLIEAGWNGRPRLCPGSDLGRPWGSGVSGGRGRGQQANRQQHARCVGFGLRRKRLALANTATACEVARG